MKKKCLAELECPLARGYNAIGDWWSLLVISQIVLGDVHRFGELQTQLGMAKNILAARLKKLCDEGILEKVPCPDGSAYHEYVATPAGRDLFKVLVAMREWGSRYYGLGGGEKHVLVDRASGRPIPPIEVRAADGRELTVDDLEVVDADPGLGVSDTQEPKATR